MKPLFAIRGGVLALFLLSAARPGSALPVFSREYRVGCQTCHTIAPRLNTFGLAFQANHFNWPDRNAPARKGWVEREPVSGLLKMGFESNRTENTTRAGFRSLDLFVADGFSLAPRRQGGYFLDVVAATDEPGQLAGNLQDAFVALPLAGSRGQLAVAFGQLSPLMYQYDPVNSLTSSVPSALGLPIVARGGASGPGGSAGGGGGGGGGGYSPIRGGPSGPAPAQPYSLTAPVPAVRLDYFDRRASGTADGNYVSLGVPLGGQLAFHHEAALHSSFGLFGNAFHREGYTTYGAFAFLNAGHHLEGLMGTHELCRNLYLTGIGAIGHDRNGGTRRLSGEAEYVLSPRLALTGRLDVVGGSHHDVAPVLGVTWYPLRDPSLRISAEEQQFQGNRRFLLFARGQF